MHRGSELSARQHRRAKFWMFGLMRPRLRSNVFLDAVPTRTFPVVPTPINTQQLEVDPDPIPIREEPAAPAQLEHSTPAEVKLAAADVIGEAWVALARKCQAAVQSPRYPYYVNLPRTRGWNSGLGTYEAAGMQRTADWNPHLAQDSNTQREWRATRPKPQHAYQKYRGPLLEGNLPLSQTSLAQQEI